ncbi:MAG TPA: hypothetical protein VHX59_22310 [Mycobacteriales bacterium]|jgi:hypothetical protein|nr:hypothetical protein [Mycobacteriales bacterium]
MLQQMGRAALPFAVFFTVVPGLLLLAETPGTAGFAITAFTVTIGAIFLIIAVILLRFPRQPPE